MVSPKEIRHMRIIQLRNLALNGASVDKLLEISLGYGVSQSTALNYLKEVRDSIVRKIKK